MRLSRSRDIVLKRSESLNDQYQTVCSVLLSVLNQIAQESLDFRHASELLEALIGRVARREFRIAVVGAFSRGKSTLLNALMGTELLPSGILPTTAGRTHVMRSRDGSARAYVFGRPNEHISVLSIANSVAHGVELAVEHPDVCLPQGTSIIDTPGFDGNIVSHEETATGSLQDADICMLLCKPSPGIGAAEQRMLANASGFHGLVVIVQNESDTVESESEVTSALDHNIKAATAALGYEPRAFAVSAIQALHAKLHTARSDVPDEWADFEAYLCILAWAGRGWARSALVEMALPSVIAALEGDLAQIHASFQCRKAELDQQVEAASCQLEHARLALDEVGEELRAELDRAWAEASQVLASLVTEVAGSNNLWPSVARFFTGDRRQDQWRERWSPAHSKLVDACRNALMATDRRLQELSLCRQSISSPATKPPSDLAKVPTDFSDQAVITHRDRAGDAFRAYIQGQCTHLDNKATTIAEKDRDLREFEQEVLQFQLLHERQCRQACNIRLGVQQLTTLLEALKSELDRQVTFLEAMSAGKLFSGVHHWQASRRVESALRSLRMRYKLPI
jgi:hypothetical protein